MTETSSTAAKFSPEMRNAIASIQCARPGWAPRWAVCEDGSEHAWVGDADEQSGDHGMGIIAEAVGVRLLSSSYPAADLGSFADPVAMLAAVLPHLDGIDLETDAYG